MLMNRIFYIQLSNIQEKRSIRVGCSQALFLATNIFLKFTYKILNSVYIKGGLDKFPLSKTTLNALKIKLKNKSKESLQEF